MMQVSSSTASQSENLSGNYFDRCIMNAFESITKVGGYMMMFSVLIQLLASALPDNTASLLLYSSLEISTGIRRLASSALYTSHKIILCAALYLFRRLVLYCPDIFHDLRQSLTNPALYSRKTGHRIGNQSSYLRLHICYLIVS